MRYFHLGILLGGLTFCALTNKALADGWGNIKGQIVWSKKDVPADKDLMPNKDQQHCLSKGPLLSDELVIDKATSGVANVMIWLAPMQKGAKIPINPGLAAVPKDTVIIDQPCCKFEPRITMMREGQTLIVKNSAPVPHNSRISGNPGINGTKNPNIPPGAQVEFSGATKLKAEPRPLLLGCDIHGWMAGRIAIFDHPYFALSKKDGTFEIKDAPAGTYKIYIQHEKAGWVHKGNTSAGQEIVIPAGGTLDLGKYDLKIED